MSDSEDEKLIDYSQLLNKKKIVLKRGVKSSNYSSEQQLSNAREALFSCLLQTASSKNASQGELSPNNGWTLVKQVKGTHLHTMGFSHDGQIALYPEEAAFLVSRNALVVHNNDQKPILFENFLEIMCESRDGWITYDKFQVYAYLKRLGFIVMRSKPVIRQLQERTVNKLEQQPISIWKLFFDRITHWIYDHQAPIRPLVWDYRYRDYMTVYSTLQIIPSSPWYRPFYHTPKFDWDVYKPRPTWKKRDPGIPDFQVVVRNIHDRMPSLYEQNAWFSYSKPGYEPVGLRKTKLDKDVPTLIMALVGEDGVTFLRMIGDDLADISMDQHNIQRNKIKKKSERIIM
ncbi:uncharacterized protein BX663DRAFT_523310 [Cokeromyces recurvatus]|uniref:uncharacterized protein n=1 Tax=Cokeromyces recurvatus TaxID=90255 RepID=UPI00221E5BCE|nr:uncharacterized protein BX663DRAFT_523310 [Cokeromyces recurvatus]KAI7898939.1 hypothetical protein BX663DRAFT_523310 [Cokeromyces recurvatus]